MTPTTKTKSETVTSRPTILRLMFWTAGVAVALSVLAGLNQLGVSAWNSVSPHNPRQPGLSGFDYAIAIVYGTCLALFLVTLREKDFWRSPGKIILMIFAFICVTDWGLTTFASSMVFSNVTSSVIMEGETVIGVERISASRWVSQTGKVFGIYFQDFPGTVGYLFGIPILSFVLFRSREEGKQWKLVWLGFLIFNVAMLAKFNAYQQNWIPWLFSSNYYFEIVLGVPVVGMVGAFLLDLFRNRKVDWWTIVACTLLPCMWVLMWVLSTG